MVSLHRREDLVVIALEKHLSVKATAETFGYNAPSTKDPNGSSGL
jgi:hypothetical protein